MKPFGIVYVIECSASGKKYVGITRQGVAARWRSHVDQAMRGKPWMISRAIRRYGQGAFEIVALEGCGDIEELNAAEQKWIDALGTMKPNGYNLTAGGDGVKGWKAPPEFCKAIGDRCRGRSMSKGARQKMSAAKKGKPHSEELRAKWSKIRTGRRHSSETRKKIGEAHLGKRRTPEQIEKMVQARSGFKHEQAAKDAISRPVVAQGKEYRSLGDAAKALGVWPATISRRIQNGVTGYWSIGEVRERAKRSPDQVAAMKQRASSPVIADGKWFPSITQAAECLGLTRPGVAYRIKIGRHGYKMAS